MKQKLFVVALVLLSQINFAQNGAVVFQTDFGLKDGAVSAMKGVAFGVSADLKVFDLTHEIPPFNIWEAAYRLNQTANYWPSGTVFVSVVDPGVGSARKSVVLKTKTGHFFVSPDNGSLTLIAESLGIESIRQIDETKNRLKNSNDSYTFHGRDVYAFTGARLASRTITFEEVGPLLPKEIVQINYEKARVHGQEALGTIDVLDVQYGNAWSNISRSLLAKLLINYGERVHIQLIHNEATVFEQDVYFGKTFSDVAVGETVAYINSLNNFSIGINQDDFAKKYRISSGPDWKIIIAKAKQK